MQGEVPVRLVETPYAGELTSISPERVVPGKAVLITGRAVDRSGQPLAGARLNLIVESRGVERLLPVVTGTDGVFTQAVTTRENDAGEYAVRVMHPDQSVKPVHGRFWVERLSVDYNRFRLQILHGQERSITVRATAAPGTVLSDLRLERAPEDPLPQGLTITPAPPVAVPQ